MTPERPEDTDEWRAPTRRSADVRLIIIERELANVEIAVRELRDDVRKVASVIDRWRFGFWVLGALGAVVAWTLSSWHSILRVFRGD